MHPLEEKWPFILETIKTECNLSDVSFNTWLKPLELYSVEGNVITVTIPAGHGEMTRDYITRKYLMFFEVTICDLLGLDHCEINFIMSNQIPSPKTSYNKLNNDTRYEEANLNAKYTFDTFIVGSNNKLAHAAALAVAESPGDAYNPLFIYGGAGLGKTHLMHSIAHFILDHDPESRVLYVTSEDFTNELINIIRNNNGNNSDMTKFREKYRNVDVLLVDDIQFIIGKETTQEEFFHTFNTLHTAQKQIIISSDKPPKDMEILEERFRSRFEWGLITDISLPDYETKVAILHKKEELEGYNVSDDVIQYIADNVKSNIRELEGAFNKVVAYARLEHKEVSLELAQQALKDMISPSKKTRVINEEFIIATVADHFSLTAADLCSKKRNAKISYPRQIAMYLCREFTSNAYTNIGNAIGNRDHSTVMHGIEKIEEDLKTDEQLQSTIEILKKKINA